MITMYTKKDFQKVIGAIRKERQVAANDKHIEYPKAMMTAQQRTLKSTARATSKSESIFRRGGFGLPPG